MVKCKEIMTPLSLAAVIIDGRDAYIALRSGTLDPVTRDIEIDNLKMCSKLKEQVIKSVTFNN